MINYVLVSIAIYIILIAVIVILSIILFRKKEKSISEDNDKIIEAKKLTTRINKMSKNKKIVMEKKINEATNLNDYINVFTQL